MITNSIDAVIGFLFSNLMYVHLIIVGTIAIKFIHFTMSKHRYWAMIDLLYFSKVSIEMAHNKQRAFAKVVQNRLSDIIVTLFLMDVFFSFLKILISHS